MQIPGITQAAIFTVEYCLFNFFTSIGMQADCVLGHSLGEFGAAVAANIMEPEDALRLIIDRSTLDKIHCSSPRGGMLIVESDLKTTEKLMEQAFPKPLIGMWLDIAGENSPEQTVLSGTNEAITHFAQFCRQQRIRTRDSVAKYAYHSRLMEPALAAYAKAAEKIHYRKPCITFLSGMEGRELEAVDAPFWVSHKRERVRFRDACSSVLGMGFRVFVELGPTPILSKRIKRNAEFLGVSGVHCIEVMQEGQPELEKIHQALQLLRQVGYTVPIQ